MLGEEASIPVFARTCYQQMNRGFALLDYLCKHPVENKSLEATK
jgi:hypothetical protein